MDQRRKWWLLHHLKKRLESMKGQNSLVRIITTKQTKLSLGGQLHMTLGTLFSPFKWVIIIEVPPAPRPKASHISTANHRTLHLQTLEHSSWNPCLPYPELCLFLSWLCIDIGSLVPKPPSLILYLCPYKMGGEVAVKGCPCNNIFCRCCHWRSKPV